MSGFGRDYAEVYVPPPDEEYGHPEDAREAAGTSWLPVDLADVLAGLQDGTLSRPEATVGALEGEAGGLFYPGRINGVAGESGSGKTWTALVAVAQELEAGNNVVYVDLEDDVAGMLGRLLAVGAKPNDVRDRFCYLSPTERLDAVARSLLTELLADRTPSLAVVDSTGEGLALQGANPNADEEVAAWFRLLPRLLASTGAAVVVLDHTTKSGDGGLWPIGSQRKRAAITGAQYMQETVRPFSRDSAGHAVLKCAKDRAGTYRAGQRVAELHVTPTGTDAIEAHLRAAEESTGAAGTFRPTVLMERVSNALDSAPEPLTFNGITERVTGKRKFVRDAVDLLIAEGHIDTNPGPRSSTLHTLVRPFTEAHDNGEPVDAENTGSGVSTGSGSLGGEPGTSRLTGSGNRSGTSGNQSDSCTNPTHSPRLVAGCWTCPDCDQEATA